MERHTTTEALDFGHNAIFKVLGVPIEALQIPDLITRMERWIRCLNYGNCITFANVHVVIESLHDGMLKTALMDSKTLTVPDGKPLIWMARFRGFGLQRRVYGPDLMYDFVAATANSGYRHYFYGGAPGVPQKLAAELCKRFPSLIVSGMYSPPFRPLSDLEDDEVIAMINSTRPDVLWIGLGCPKQEKWAFEHRDRLEVPVIAAVGQAFDIHAGVARQAPRWMGEHGLEWLFRLVREPRRLWRRYLLYNTEFLWKVVLESLGLKQFT
jgi:N-acetylglucosaminyldiphosphoundecaprenol N-acetyl-beta-D-mannosaminyltransferase